MLTIQNISYTHQDKFQLFKNISLAVGQHQKIALIGNNGSGKSTLLKIIAGRLAIAEGQVFTLATPYYVPQIFGQYNHLTIAEALQVNQKLTALTQILGGKVTEENYTILNDDWTIEERCKQALDFWRLPDFDLTQKLETLSGGQKTKVFLAGLMIHKPELVLLDEASNHLDTDARKLLYNYIETTTATLLVVSHDRTLINLIDTVCELTRQGITTYGGNYDFYLEQKQDALNALQHDVQSKEKALRKAREKERETLERQQKLDNRGKRKQEKAGVARIMMNTLQNNAQNSSAKLKDVHSGKIDGISSELQSLRASLPVFDKMKFGFISSTLHSGKVLFKAENINHCYDRDFLWKENISLQIHSGERIALQGANGSGKTTLIHIIMDKLSPTTGIISSFSKSLVYIDQDYSLINDSMNVYSQAQHFNTSALPEHEVKIRLSRFLFAKDVWDKPCSALSGGEKMRLAICCLTMSSQSPDMIILDEPTNNLDIQNIEILTAAINEYQGTLLVVSHDTSFLDAINIQKFIRL